MHSPSTTDQQRHSQDILEREVRQRRDLPLRYVRRLQPCLTPNAECCKFYVNTSIRTSCANSIVICIKFLSFFYVLVSMRVRTQADKVDKIANVLIQLHIPQCTAISGSFCFRVKWKFPCKTHFSWQSVEYQIKTKLALCFTRISHGLPAVSKGSVTRKANYIRLYEFYFNH